MTRQDLNQDLAFLFVPGVELQVVVYAVLKDTEEIKQLDIKGDDLPEIRKLFLDSIQNQILAKGQFEVLKLSTADERGSCFYEYDLEIPEELLKLTEVIGNDHLENFNFNDDVIEDIETLLVVIGNDQHQVSLFKKISPIEIIGRGGFILKRSAERFERLDDNLLRISSNFQALSINGSIIILNLSTIEKSFGIINVIQREASRGIEAIRNIAILSNIESLEDMVEDISFARKLTKIAYSSPVIANNIPNHQIINFSNNHPALRGKMRYSADNTMINLDTRVSKNLFIKILNDDYLTSELTRLYYDSLAKDGIPVNMDEEDFNLEG